MVISHKHRFIFIKTAKTAGTSIEAFLSRHCGPEDVFTPTRPPVEGHEPRNWQGRFNPLPELWSFRHPRDPKVFVERRFFSARRTLKDWWQRRRYHEHIPARVARMRMPEEVWSGYYKFTVERNPWDKTLSHYHMQSSVRGGRLSLDEYFERGEFSLNLPFYTDRDGGLMVDEVIRYEDLAEGMGRICERFGIPWEGSLGVRAKAEYRKDRTHYSQVLNARQREILERVFAREIEMHGYRWDEAPGG